MKLIVQEFLKMHSFEELRLQHGVYVSFSNDGHKFSLNYDMLEAVESDPLAQECRGLILSFADKSKHVPHDKILDLNIIPGETNIVAFGLRRFFNEGQGAAHVNWNDPNLCVMEKLDGSLIQLYFDQVKNEWHCATRSVPEANLVNESSMTFRQLFEKALLDTSGKTFAEFTAALPKHKTYCFELCTPLNRVVCYYADFSVTLLAVRDNLTLLEETPMDLGVPVVKTYSFTDVKSIVEWVATQNPLDHEGVVAKDSNFCRVKIKNPGYVAFNKVANILKTSDRALIELILLEKEDDVIPFLPDMIVEKITKYKSSIKNMIVAHEICFKEAKEEAESKKAFAQLICVKDNIWTAPLFYMYDKKVTFKDFVKTSSKDGTWGNNFIDKILFLCEKY